MSECPVPSVSKHIFHGKWYFGRSMWFSYKPIKRTNAIGETKSIYILESAGNWVCGWQCSMGLNLFPFGVRVIFTGESISKEFIFYVKRKKRKEKKIGSVCISKEFKISNETNNRSVTFIWRIDRKICRKNQM